MTKEEIGKYRKTAFDDDGNMFIDRCRTDRANTEGGHEDTNCIIFDNVLIPIKPGNYDLSIDLNFVTEDFQGVEFNVMTRKLKYKDHLKDWHLYNRLTYTIPGIECDGRYYHSFRLEGPNLWVCDNEIGHDMYKFVINKKGKSFFTNDCDISPIKLTRTVEKGN